MKKDLGIPQISTGDILRDAVAAGTDLGKQAKAFMDAGQLVTDGLILDLMRDRLGQSDAAAGFILDGFPRTVAQAEGLAQILDDQQLKVDRVLMFDVATEELVGRLTSRRVCPDCKAVYNVSFRPPKKEGICDHCGGGIIQREDDREETVRRRLQVYEDQTAPLVDYYRTRGLLAVIDGNRGFEETRAQARETVGL
jgi:adenylate kinase